MVERRPPQAPSASDPDAGQREDTVAIPVNRPASGNGKVLPPMPKDPPAGGSATPPADKPATRPTSRGRARSAAKSAAKPPAPPTAQSTARPTARPTAQPATQSATKAAPPAPAKVAPTPASGTPVASPMPVVPAVDKRAERQAAREAKAAEQAARQAARQAAKPAPKPSRRARLRMTRIDPWSVMKTAFLLSIAFGIVVVVSVFMVWSVLDAANVWSSINQTVRDVLGGESATSFDIEDYLGTRRVVGFAMVVAAVDVVLLTAIATLAAFLYNMSASLLGGIEVTLAEDR